MKNILLLMFLTLFSSSCQAQKQNFLHNKTFTSKIYSICEETSEYNPCAGQEVYLILKFTPKKVVISEKYVSSCEEEDTINLGRYKWRLLTNGVVKIDFGQEQQSKDLKNLTLKLENKVLKGTFAQFSEEVHIFNEIKKK